VNHCADCRYWESAELDLDDGRSVCLKLTEATMEEPPKKLRIIRTTGDQGCAFWRPMTAGQLTGVD